MSAHEETWTKVNAHVDRGIVDLVSALSEIPDLETLESCQGEQDKQDAFVIFRFGKWHKCGEFLFERLLSHMDDDIRSDVTLSIIGYDPTNCHGRISLVPAAVSRMASIVRTAAHAHWKWFSENEDAGRVREGEMPKMTELKTTDLPDADIIRAATLAERERCIKIVREHLGHKCHGGDCTVQILSQIERIKQERCVYD